MRKKKNHKGQGGGSRGGATCGPGGSKGAGGGSLQGLSLHDVEVIFMKSEIREAVRVCTTPDGKIDFRRLGVSFGLDPNSITLGGSDSITLGGFDFPRNSDLRSESPWTDIQNIVGAKGTKEDPVIVSGRPILEAPTGSLIGTMLPKEHLLSKFVDCLRDKDTQDRINGATPGSVIDLPSGVPWLGDKGTFSNQLYFRACYEELLDAKNQYFQLDPKLTSVVYTGTPGIGKSHLCALVIARELIAGKVVYFEKVGPSNSAEAIQFYKLELHVGVRVLDSFTWLCELSNTDVNAAVYVVDGGAPSIINSSLNVQVFASPSKALFNAKKKVYAGHLYLHTPLFTLEELESCRVLINVFKSITKDTLEAWFAVTGGVAKFVLTASSSGQLLEQWMDVAHDMIMKKELPDFLQIICQLRTDTFPEHSDSLFHWRVDEKNVNPKGNKTSPQQLSLRRFRHKTVCFASDWVAKEFTLKLQLDGLLKVVSLMIHSTGEVHTAALRGYWFETLSHMVLSSGNTFNCRWLDNGETFKLKLPLAKLEQFKDSEEVWSKAKDDLKTYCKPRASNQVAIDSLSSPYLFFQIASGPAHTINEPGLKRILNGNKYRDRLTPDAWDFVCQACEPRVSRKIRPLFVFCTTPANFGSHYRALQSYVGKNSEEGKRRKKFMHDDIWQVVLEIPLDFSEEAGTGRSMLHSFQVADLTTPKHLVH